MGFFTNVFNRIYNLFIKQPKLNAATPEKIDNNNQVSVNVTEIDSILAQQFNYECLKKYEDFSNYNAYCQRFFSQGANTPMQYDYRNMIQYMEQTGAMDDFLYYHDYLINNQDLIFPSKVHGIEHTSRVTFLAEILTTLDNVPKHLKILIMLGAVLHDIGRGNDKKDPNHGQVSVQKINYYHLLDGLNPRDKDIVCFAVGCHSMEKDEIEKLLIQIPPKDRADYKLVLNYLQDADKLDRVRIANEGWGLDPFRLSTDRAKMLVKFAHQNYGNFNRIINYERQKDKIRAEIDLKQRCYKLIRTHAIIPYQVFEEILNEYRPGTLELLEKEGRLQDILSYETFQRYGKEESVRASHKVEEGKPDLTLDGLFEDSKRSEVTSSMISSIEMAYMVLYTFKKNHPDGYSLYLMCDTDTSVEVKVGILSILTMNDIIEMRDAGFPYRISDVVELAKGVSLEELKTILDTKDYSRLASRPNISQEHFNRIKEKLAEFNIKWTDKYIRDNYAIIEEIASFPDVLASSDVFKYTLPEIYAACTRIDSAAERIIYDEHGEEQESYGEKIPRDANSVLKYLKFFKNINAIEFYNDDRQFEIISEVGNKVESLSTPSYISYLTHQNKPYEASTLSEKVNYKRFCIERVLADTTLSLDEAKEKLMFAFFDFNVPPEYMKEFEQNLITELHYYRNYFSSSEQGPNNSLLCESLWKIFNSKTREEFEEEIKKASTYYDTYNLDALQIEIKSRLMDVSKDDIIKQLKDTENMISGMSYENVVATDGTVVKAKVLRGHPFKIATTTLMPICSPHTKHEKKMRPIEEIRNEIINQGISPFNICTTISTDYMLGRAAAVSDDCEVVYGYVIRTPKQIGVSANYDLSTRKVPISRNGEERITQKPTLYLTVEDYMKTQVESHGETVINAYPRYIICYDEINSLAIEKKRQLDIVYQNEHISPPVEFVLISAKDIYIPRIKGSIQNRHSKIIEECREGTFSLDELDEYILNREGNIIIDTIQAANSVTIKKGILFPKDKAKKNEKDFISTIFDSLATVLEEVSKYVPPDKIDEFRDAVQLVIDRGDSNTEIGKRYYNYNYVSKIPIDRFRSLIGENTNREDESIQVEETPIL